MKVTDREHVLLSTSYVMVEVATILLIGDEKKSTIPVGARSGKIAECLARSMWLDETLGRPVSAAERAGLIPRLEQWTRQQLLSARKVRRSRRSKRASKN